MSYLFSGESARSRQDTLNNLSNASFTEADQEAPIFTPENYAEGITAGPRIAANAAAGLAIPLSKLASGVTKAIDDQFGTNTDDWWHKHVTQSLIYTSDKLLTPDPKTTHVALQIADQFATTAAKYFAVGGNPYLFGTFTGAERAVREAEKGKSADTALQMGAIEGVTNLLGAKLPPAFASNKINLPQTIFNVPTGIKSALTVPVRVQGAVTGAAINAGIGIPARVATANALELGGYPEEAKQSRWNDPVGLGVDVGLGMLFGAAHQYMLPSHMDAILTANDARAIETPQVIRATNPAAHNSLVDNMNAAVQALVNDEPVSAALTARQRFEAQNQWHKNNPADPNAPAPEKTGKDINPEPLQPGTTAPETSATNPDGFIFEPWAEPLDEQIQTHITDTYNEAHVKAVDTFINDNPELINGIIDKNYKVALTDIAQQAGWDTTGGQILRDEHGNVTARTPWLPKQEWFSRFIKEGIGGKKDLEKAVTRFNEGKPLGPTQTKIIDWLKQEVDGNNLDQQGNSFSASNRREDLRTQILDKMQVQEEQRAKQAEDRKANLSGQNVYDAVLGQLQKTGRFDMFKDEGFAKFMQHTALTQAKRLKMTPDDYYKEYGAKIVGKMAVDRQTEAFGQPLPEVKNYIPEGQTHIDIDGVQRPALNSNGKPIHPTVEGVQNFYKWFGDSKVVDEQGRPLEVYHGTTKNGIEIFNTNSHFGTKNQSNEILNRNQRISEGNQNVIPVYLQADKIKRAEDALGVDWKAEIEKAKAENYDAIIYQNWGEWDMDANGNPKDSYIVFKPEQIKSATGNTGAFDANNPNILHQFAGDQARTADLFQLEIAKQRLDKGEDAETIRQETGWFKGADGKMRFEIDDSQASIKKPFPQLGQRWGDIYYSRMQKEINEGLGVQALRLGDILNHPRLYEAYPDLKDLTVTTKPGKGAQLAPSTSISPVHIAIGEDMSMSDVKSLLLHEVQHGIQTIEGFSSGGSPNNMRLSDFAEVDKQRIESLRIEAEQALKVGDKALAARLSNQRAQLYYPAQYDAYQRLYGEVEARNTQARAGLSDEERQILPPETTQDVNNSDVVVVFNGKDMENAPVPENARPLRQSQAGENKGAYHPDSRTISLFASADASTFLHESGHYFLDLYTDMIKSGVSDGIIDADMNTLLKWFGVDDFQTWARMSVDEQRPYHEQFAKGFETYLAEGTAPTPELLSLFQSFAKWLKEVYGDVQKALGVNLTDEVRGVMDRIIADGQSKAQANDTPEITAARQLLPSIDEARQFEITDAQGNVIDTGTAAELMARADAEALFAEQSDIATQAAITCRLKWGD